MAVSLPAARLAASLRDPLLARVLAAASGPERRDNLDWLVHPEGPPEPDPAQAHARLGELLDDLDGYARAYGLLADDASRETFVAALAQRVLGPARVVLDLDPGEYRRAYAALHRRGLVASGAIDQGRVPIEWTHNLYELNAFGTRVLVIGNGLPIAQTYLFGQYGYRRDPAIGPRAGDHALDIGACWGETALWLAAAAGPDARVRAFEPAPMNRDLLGHNVGANPALAGRIEIRSELLGARAGERIALPVAGAGAAGSPAGPDDRGGEGHVVLEAQTLDALAEGEAWRPLDLVKVDVEGAELDVLAGARETLVRDRPRLALAAYHRPEDLARLPAFLDDLDVGYRCYLQASTLCHVDLVLFAVAD